MWSAELTFVMLCISKQKQQMPVIRPLNTIFFKYKCYIIYMRTIIKLITGLIQDPLKIRKKLKLLIILLMVTIIFLYIFQRFVHSNWIKFNIIIYKQSCNAFKYQYCKKLFFIRFIYINIYIYIFFNFTDSFV